MFSNGRPFSRNGMSREGHTSRLGPIEVTEGRRHGDEMFKLNLCNDFLNQFLSRVRNHPITISGTLQNIIIKDNEI